MFKRKVLNKLFRMAGWSNPKINILRQKYKWKWAQEDAARELLESKCENKRILIAGVNSESVEFAKKASIPDEAFVGYCCISEEQEVSGIDVIDFDDILYEDMDQLEIYEFEQSHILKSIGKLHDIGIDDSHIHVMCEEYRRGSKEMDAYDINIGLVRKSSFQGFEIFEEKNKEEKPLIIVTLGGSTSDPTLCNLKSWSEFLWDSLNEMGINTRIYAGGIASYVVAQEWIKLYRDVLPLKPDVVLSYSGINDLAGQYSVDGYPFALKYMKDNLDTMISKKQIKNVLQNFNVISETSLGLNHNEDIANHWVRCERMMHAICNMDGIAFYGFLQPIEKELWRKDLGVETLDENNSYAKAKRLVNEMNEPWLVDFTDIMDGQTDVFFDRAHVYEKGNRIISSKILPYVLKGLDK